MVVRMGGQMNTGIALMTSIFASVRTFFGSRRAARQDRLTNIGTGPSNLNYTDRRSQHKREWRMMVVPARLDDSIGKRGVCFYSVIHRPYPQFDYAGELSVPLQTLVQWTASMEPDDRTSSERSS